MISQEYQKKFDKGIEYLRQGLASLRTGRASVALVENIMVSSYGERLPISHIASLNIPDAKTIVIQPWDIANIVPIEKAIQMSSVGLNPVNDGTVIRLNIPPMTEERRKEMVKVIGGLAEQARIAVRNVREEFLKELKRKEDHHELTKDDTARQKKVLQEIVDKHNSQIKEISAAKEKEIMTI